MYTLTVASVLVGGFNPSEKYESQLGLLFQVYGKIKSVPNHQPVYIQKKTHKSTSGLNHHTVFVRWPVLTFRCQGCCPETKEEA